MVDSKLGKRLERRKDKKPLGPGACGIGEIEGGYLEMKTRCRVAEKNKESAEEEKWEWIVMATRNDNGNK